MNFNNNKLFNLELFKYSLVHNTIIETYSPILPPAPECTKNDECASDKTCVNQKCISPCALSESCGRGSFCHTQNHQPVCRCPNGYTGDPRVACIPRKYYIFIIYYAGFFN